MEQKNRSNPLLDRIGSQGIPRFPRLAEAGGKIVVMGVGLSSVTGFHLTEDRMGEEFPVKVYLKNPTALARLRGFAGVKAVK